MTPVPAKGEALQFILLIVAVAVFSLVQQFIVGWSWNSIAASLSLSLLEIAVLIPIIDFLSKRSDRRLASKLRSEYGKQAFEDFDVDLVDGVTEFFDGLTENLDKQFEVTKVGFGSRVTQRDWETIFPVYSDYLASLWKSLDRLAVIYTPMMMIERDHERYGRLAWLNAIFGKLESAFDVGHGLKYDTGERVSGDDRGSLRVLVVCIAELGLWLKEADMADERIGLGIKRLRTNLRPLVDDKELGEWLDEADEDA